MEINFTYVNLVLLLLFLYKVAIFIAIFYGFVASCSFGVVFLHRAKQGYCVQPKLTNLSRIKAQRNDSAD